MWIEAGMWGGFGGSATRVEQKKKERQNYPSTTSLHHLPPSEGAGGISRGTGQERPIRVKGETSDYNALLRVACSCRCLGCFGQELASQLLFAALSW